MTFRNELGDLSADFRYLDIPCFCLTIPAENDPECLPQAQ
jgi:hypothetical protein